MTWASSCNILPGNDRRDQCGAQVACPPPLLECAALDGLQEPGGDLVADPGVDDGLAAAQVLPLPQCEHGRKDLAVVAESLPDRADLATLDVVHVQIPQHRTVDQNRVQGRHLGRMGEDARFTLGTAEQGKTADQGFGGGTVPAADRACQRVEQQPLDLMDLCIGDVGDRRGDGLFCDRLRQCHEWSLLGWG